MPKKGEGRLSTSSSDVDKSTAFDTSRSRPRGSKEESVLLESLLLSTEGSTATEIGSLSIECGHVFFDF